MPAPVRLSLAVSDYDHVRDFISGKVRAEGIEIVPIELPTSEIFRRTMAYADFDVSEISIGQYLGRYSRGMDTFRALPVFPSRVFRHSSIYVHRDGGIARPEDLAGKRIGVPPWWQTASIYGRGLLAHEYGVGLQDVEWVQAGLDDPIRNDTAGLGLPPGIRVTPVSDRTLNDMLLAREIAAVITGFEPAPFVAGDPRVVRLFTDFQAVEAAYFRATKVFPIMHTVVVRATLLERDPWIAANLYAAFVEARRRSVVRTLDGVASRFPMPWTSCHAQTVARDLGDPFPYGVEPNRPTLETFIRDAHEQGVVTRRMPIEEIFAPQLRGEV